MPVQTLPDTSLPAAGRPVRGALARPRVLALLCIVVIAAAGWIYLGVMTAGMQGRSADLGPGMGVVDWLPTLTTSEFGRALIETLCRPATEAAGVTQAGLVLVMWCAMALAMMLPTAGPMILTYADIAETAAAKNEPVVSPLVLTAGYVGVWLGFALAATVLQLVLMRLSLLNTSLVAASPLFSGAAFIAAGLYQFSSLKHACVTQCQRPFPFFFANWSTAPRDVLRMGLRQGLYCLGCCWAMMLVMFAVGIMNVVWMAALGVVMTIEKVMTTTRFSRAVGVVLIAIGAVFIVSATIAHWPARS